MPPSCGKLRSVDTWGYVSLIAAALLLGVLYFRERVRSAAIRELAIQSGFHYLGRAAITHSERNTLGIRDLNMAKALAQKRIS